MANVVRFVLESQRSFDVPGSGSFINGVLDVPADNQVAVARARFRVPPYGGVEYGTVDSATPPPTLPAVPLPPAPDPLPQYALDTEVPNLAATALQTPGNALYLAGRAASVSAVAAAFADGSLAAGGEVITATAPPFTLPHVTITTTSGADPTDTITYLDATISINGQQPYSGATQIRGRGNSTFAQPKKPWRIKLTTAASLLGLPAERDWVLLANHFDTSKVRTAVAFEMGARTGLPWTPRMRFVELTLNGTYRGIYQLGEHVERGANKVNIPAVSGTTGLPLTGGYTLEIDRRYVDAQAPGFTTTLGVMVALDDPDGTTAAHKTYIQNWVQNFETVLMGSNWLNPTTGYAQYIDMPSWVDWYMVSELASNLDSDEYSSIKMYKTRDTDTVPGRLFMGPLWDFDQSFGNNSFGTAQSPTAPWLTVDHGSGHVGFRWYARMLADPAFFSMLITRWTALRAALLAGDTIAAVVDRLVDRTSYGAARDKRRWSGNTDIALNADAMKTWIKTRIDWLSTQWVIDVTNPSAPTNVTASPGNGQASLTWTAATDNVGVTKYRVRVGGTLYSEPTTTSATITGLTNGTTYTITVSAFDGAGNESPQSTGVTVTPTSGAAALPAALVDWDPDTITGANGDAVATLPDTSGNNRSLTQSTAGNRSTLVTAALNGKKAVRLNQKYLVNEATGITGQSAVTLCLVMTEHSVPNQRGGVLTAAPVGGLDYDPAGGNFALGNPQATSETTWATMTMTGGVTSTNDVTIGSPGKAFGAFAIITVMLGRDGLPLRFFVNGAEQTPTPATANSGQLNLGQILLGARYYSGGAQLRSDISIARARMYPGRLTAGQLSTLHAELGGLFGIAVA